MNYTARYSGDKLSPVMDDLVRRRTVPFLDSVGLARPLGDLLAEAYLQGMRDAVQCLKRRSDETTN
jgi:hypothetical protein